MLSGLLHLHVGVGQHFGLFLQSHQQRGEDQLHPVGTQVPHHCFSTQQVRQDVDDVRLEQLPQHVAQHLKANREPFFLSWMPSVSVLMMSCCLRARMPRPFTSPASPYAAPFLSAYLSLSRSSCRRFLTIPAASSLMAGTKGGRQPATDSCTWGGGGEEREDEENSSNTGSRQLTLSWNIKQIQGQICGAYLNWVSSPSTAGAWSRYVDTALDRASAAAERTASSWCVTSTISREQRSGTSSRPRDSHSLRGGGGGGRAEI
ncbi:hypothetical protein F7725_012315 [Dissostichus mawsoni]|uniref:Uncharacterized protein n=1 Tax=Dissostichus mawsoni TaxID=36200 RepID=A0A7J5YN49_DISMA|nr:hypothetical protein F7725_012315 [Dissostichus mawsoni]